jgi:hypothetical protein
MWMGGVMAWQLRGNPDAIQQSRMLKEEKVPVPAKCLIGLRLAIAAAVWVFPGLVDRLYGVHLRSNPETMWPSRVLASKEVGMVVCALATRGPEQRRWWWFGAVTDLCDGCAALLGWKEGLSKRAALPIAATAAAAAALGLATLAADR